MTWTNQEVYLEQEVYIERVIYGSGRVCYLVTNKKVTTLRYVNNTAKVDYDLKVLYETTSYILAKNWLNGYNKQILDKTIISSVKML